jgi:hypothetical protein
MTIEPDHLPRLRTRRLAATLALAAATLFAVPARAQDDACTVRICTDGRHFRGDQNGGRCESVTPPFDWRSHYEVSGPICTAGWRLDGENCRKIDCCVQPACADGESYRDGVCHRGPSGFGGYRSHHDASCPSGWVLDRANGLCREPGCSDVGARPLSAERRHQPPPPARAAAPDDGRPRPRSAPPARAAGTEDGLPRPRPAAARPPPPPAVAGRGDETFQAVITGLVPDTCVDRGGSVVVRGARFGDQQGTRRAVLGGHGLSVRLTVLEWSGDRLRLAVPDDGRIRQATRYYIGLQDAAGLWITNISTSVRICGPLQ